MNRAFKNIFIAKANRASGDGGPFWQNNYNCYFAFHLFLFSFWIIQNIAASIEQVSQSVYVCRKIKTRINANVDIEKYVLHVCMVCACACVIIYRTGLNEADNAE